MAIELNHTIVCARDKEASARFLTEILDLPPAKPFGPFLAVELSNGVTLDFMEVDAEIASQHYAFLVSEEEFTASFARVKEKGLDYWADPHQERPGEINTNDGGRGVYFADPDGHFLELITRPYGSGAQD
ncbi:VOC family protein [Nocardiopsis gilva YIM 90087]|uniref:VOC family protein n=1 Tax=Nocardiopsis gilva YIM 90087 TaxID=1235441 RepID=A0A223S9A6_9ACTN|nr:VOC family protein [Nocardiopsis gilva]ASU84696.1 VOC family protein [Nocardiopsis gilva YIM 90087]